MNDKGRMVLAIWSGVLLLAAPTAAPGADEAPSERPGTIWLANYAATAFSYHDTGSLLWLSGPGGILRLEVRRGNGGDDMLAPLLEQRGRGWTAILSGPGDDTLNAWGEPWRRPAPGVARAAQLVTQALLDGPEDIAPREGLWRAKRSASAWRMHRIPALIGGELAVAGDTDSPADARFRGRMASRGRGRGGTDEMLALAWRQPTDRTGARLQVRATRRPGTLELSSPTRQDVQYAMPEAFVPLWPLAQLVTFGP